MRKRRQTVEMPPQFFKIILSPHASKLHIPDEFVIKYGADLRDVVFLEVPTGAIWQVKLLQNSNGTKWLNYGWNQFKAYYSIAIGYFLLFQYNGNSHFSVFIFDLSASEIEYLSGPNEDDNNNNNAKVAHPVSGPNCLAERQEVKLEKPDVEEDLTYATQKHKKKEKNLYNEHCNEVLHPNTTKYNKRKYSLNLEASHRRYPLRSKQVKLEQSKANGSPSYSGKQTPATSLSFPGVQSERKESTRVKLEKANSEEDFCCALPKAKRGEVTKQHSFVRLITLNYVTMDAILLCSSIVILLAGHCNEAPVVDPSTSKMTTTNQHSKKRTATSLDASNCRYPLRSKQLKDVKIEKGDVEGIWFSNMFFVSFIMLNYVMTDAIPLLFSSHIILLAGRCNEAPVVDPSTSQVTTTNQHSKKRTAASLDASNCRYPLRSKQLKEVKIEKGDVKEHCNKIAVVDPSATKMTTTPRHHEKKTSASLDTSHCKYPLRNKQLKEVKLEKTNAEEDLLYVAQKAMRKKANNVKLEKGDVEERSKAGDPSASTTTNQHHEKKTTTPLDASHCRYPLRSKQHIEVKLEQWETGGNMHNKTPKNKVVADSPYCIRQNLGLPASSPSYQPVRVKLEKPDNLFCAAEKVKGRETNNVKLDTGDLEGNLIAASYKGKDSTASEMTVLGKKKMLPSEKHNRDMYFNPHFTVSMQPTCVSRNFQLDIPVEFFKKCLNEEETIVNLRVSNGRSWRAKLLDIQSNCPKMESSGWRDFVLDNNLKEHDTCVFELIDGIEPMLDVTIFRATTPVS
ncbi:hypothetical protein H5410_005180 [Solanum commersonii]|uniref:TF-B3 domain-containing protein n=1 Tax=Solanum commersonii TaxID=4109 RepID=A0A9J6A6G8_SOLCO|nr:hypothetical protein H5410_005180 [Solanum commersonii]